MLEIKNLQASINNKSILKGLNLVIKPGELHAIMGPNGSGKSTLANVLSGKIGYEISGELNFRGEDLKKIPVEKRAQKGIFLAFQYPLEIPGVNTNIFLKTSLNSIRKSKGEKELDTLAFLKLVKEKCSELGIDEKILSRQLNVGFSGGEKKKNEILQMKILDPNLSILDETDSGLDIDALKIRKVRQILPPKDPSEVSLMPRVEEYFAFNEAGMDGKQGGQVMRIATDSVAYCHSGLLNEDKRMVLSYLHKAIKPLNQLRMIEDSVVIYRISRAPERRIFYIDVGNLPKQKAEQYLKDIMTRYKNKLVYDANTGEVRDDRKHQSMLEDYWLPRREGGRGTEITTLPGGENLGELADVEYFQKKLYKSLNVPVSRLESESGFVLGRAQEISRDEVKFTRFIERLRNRFNHLFNTCLEKQLILKGVLTLNDWRMIEPNLFYEWQSDSHFSELKEAEMLNERLSHFTEYELC